MVCRVNLGWTIDLLWKTQHRRMMLRVRFRFPFPARVAHHRNVPRLGSNHPSHPASSVPHVHYGCLLLTTTSVTSSTTTSSSSAVTTPIAYTHTDAAPFRTSTVSVAMAVAVVVAMVVTMIVVVVTIVSSPVTAICCFRLEIQAFQLFTEVVIAAVLVWVIPVVPLAGRSGTTGTERILVTELFTFAVVLVKV